MNYEFHVSDVLLTFLIYQTRKKKKELKKGGYLLAHCGEAWQVDALPP